MEAQVSITRVNESEECQYIKYRTINRGGNSIFEMVRKAGFDPYVCSLSRDI